MRPHTLASLIVLASAGALAAQDRTDSTGTHDFAEARADTETVHQGRTQIAEGFNGVALAKASVDDVDLNGDGHISFDELLRFDLTKDF